MGSFSATTDLFKEALGVASASLAFSASFSFFTFIVTPSNSLSFSNPFTVNSPSVEALNWYSICFLLMFFSLTSINDFGYEILKSVRSTSSPFTFTLKTSSIPTFVFSDVMRTSLVGSFTSAITEIIPIWLIATITATIIKSCLVNDSLILCIFFPPKFLNLFFKIIQRLFVYFN